MWSFTAPNVAGSVLPYQPRIWFVTAYVTTMEALCISVSSFWLYRHCTGYFFQVRSTTMQFFFPRHRILFDALQLHPKHPNIIRDLTVVVSAPAAPLLFVDTHHQRTPTAISWSSLPLDIHSCVFWLLTIITIGLYSHSCFLILGAHAPLGEHYPCVLLN